MMKTESKGKRILAAILALCMSLQLFGWNIEPFQVFAGESGEKPLQKTITVSEKEISKALEKEPGESAEINEEILPYIGTQKEMAKDHLESLLSQAVIIKQKSLGSKCAAIVAVEADDELEKEELPDGEEIENQDEEEPDKGIDYDRILMIGINGNEKRDCEFTLEITNAEGIVVKELKVTGYRQDRELATDSNATATASNAKMTDSNASKIIRDDETVKTPTDSDTEKEDDRTYLFVEDYNEVYDEAAASRLLTSKDKKNGIALLSLFNADEEKNDPEEKVQGEDDLETTENDKAEQTDDEQADEAPKMMARRGGFAMAVVLKETEKNEISSNLARVGVYATEKIVESGNQFAIYASAAYSAISSSNIKKAFYTVDFEVDSSVEDLIVGPESETHAMQVDVLSGEEAEDWKTIKDLLGSVSDDWKYINVESSYFFYSKKEMKAVFSLQGENGQGSTVSGIPFRFRFLNNLTPDGTVITATPGVLNKKQLEDDYSAHNGGISADGQITIGSKLTVECKGNFKWKNVDVSQQGNLGNLNGTADGSNIRYIIKTAPEYGSDKNSGVIYTKAYAVTDRILFDNFYIDGTDCTIDYISGRSGEFNLVKNGNKMKLIGLDLPASAMKDGVAQPIYEGDSKKIIGVEIKYTVVNDTLNAENPSDLTLKTMDKKEGESTIWFHYGSFKGTGLLKFEGDGHDPKVTNTVYFDAYSLGYNGSDYPSEEIEENYGKKNTNLHHHSYKKVASESKPSYSITKKAYRDEDRTEEAVGENQVFGPERVVYYTITVENNGYSEKTFRVEDQVPEGLTDLQLQSLAIGNPKVNNGMENQTSLPKDEKDTAKKTVSWDKIKIPAGESAVFYVSGTIKSKDELDQMSSEQTSSEQTSSEQTSPLKTIHRLDNTARLYFSGSTDKKAESTATVFAKIDELSAGEVEFEKARSGSEDLFIGSDVTYILSAILKDETTMPQKLTLTDHWPKQLTLKQINAIPAGAVVNLKDSGGNIIATYTNKAEKDQTANVPGSFTVPSGSSIKKADIAKHIEDVEIEVLVDGQTEKKINLVGTVTAGGEIINNAETSAGNSGEVKVVALAMKIEKEAYRIASADRDNITDENSLTNPVNEKVTFTTNDVICYEVAVTNTGTENQMAIEPLIEDDFSNLFGLAEVPTLAKATLSSKNGSVFTRREAGANVSNWEPVEVNNGKLQLNLSGKALKPGEIERIRIYVSVPKKAVADSTKTFKNTAKSTLQIGGQKYSVKAFATVTTVENEVQSASIEKEVVAVARNLTTNGGIKLLNAKWKDKELFGEGKGYITDPAETEAPFTVGTGDYVFYRMKVHNASNTPIEIYEIEDWLPEGMEFSRFYTFNPQQRKNKENGTWGAEKGTDTLNLQNLAWGPTLIGNTKDQNWLFYDDAASANKGADYGSGVKHTADHMKIDGTTYRARTYGDVTIDKNSNEVAVINPGKTMVFGIIAKVTGKELTSGMELTNTAGFITDSTVVKESGTDCTEVYNIKENLDGMESLVGGKNYLTDEYKAFTSSATVIYRGYTPGIEKELSQYYLTNQWNNYDPANPPTYFAPTDHMRWTIKLSNGLYGRETAGAIEEYTVSDTLPLGLDYNSEDTEGNHFKVTNGTAVELPKPERSTTTDGKNVVSWRVKKTENGFSIVGADGEEIKTQQNLSIPAYGSIDLQISTKPAESAASLRYGSYMNQADLIPAERYTYNASCAGDIVKTETERMIRATAQVDIYGSGRTESWKEISGSYNGTSESVSGRDTHNYILSDAGGTVNYRLNVQNQSDGALKNLVIMDHLPAPGDNGLVNNSKRYSDFAVKFSENPKIQVMIDGKLLTANEYDVYFGKWSELASNGSALSDEQWRVGNHANWSPNFDENLDSVRIEIRDPEVLKNLGKEKVLTVSFDAVVPEADALKDLDTAIAWNTFGYSYEIGGVGDGTFLTVEPAKVGVKIPTAQLSVKKEVESQIAGDDTRKFTFILEKKEKGSIRNLFADQWIPVEGQKYTIDGQTFYTGLDAQTMTAAGQTLGAGEFLLAHGQRAVFTVVANGEYRVRELDADGFVVEVTPFTKGGDGEFSGYNELSAPKIEPLDGETYYCTFKNIKSSLVLPETGGMGTGRFHMAGMFTMILAALLAAGYWMISISKLKKEKDGNGYEKEN